MYAHLKNFFADKGGATAIEYALIAALISMVVVAGASTVGSTLSGTFNSVAGNLR